MSKGKRREKDAEGVYERGGFAVYRPQESKWGETDMYGLFDLLAVPPAGSNAKVRLVQVKANEARGIEGWAEDAMNYASASVHVEMAVCHDGTNQHDPPKWRLLEPRQRGGGTEYETTIDEREDDTDADGVTLASYLAEFSGVEVEA